MVRRALALVVPLALAELVAAALFQLPLRTSAPSIGTRPRTLKNYPVANWQRLAALQRQHGHPEAAQYARDEERLFFTELLAEVMGGHQRIPDMFSDLVSDLPSARQTVALAAATQSGFAVVSPKAQLDMSSGAHDEFYAQVRGLDRFFEFQQGQLMCLLVARSRLAVGAVRTWCMTPVRATLCV